MAVDIDSNLLERAALVFVLVIILIIFLGAYARRIGLVDRPCGRKTHTGEIPVVGGLAIFIVIFLADAVFGFPEKLRWILVAASVLVLVGLLDDLIEIGIRIRLAVQALSTVIMIAGTGLWISDFGFGPLNLQGIDSIPLVILTTLAVIGLTNSFNMCDGIDGLASGLAIISFLILSYALENKLGRIPQIGWIVLLISATLGFFVINVSLLPIGKVFLGDAGSLLLGFVVSWTLIYFTQLPHDSVSPVLALWCVVVPVFDTVAVVAHRIFNRKSPFLSDRNHLHHILLGAGLHPHLVLLVVLSFAASIGLLGVTISEIVLPEISLALYALLLGIYVWLVGRKRHAQLS